MGCEIFESKSESKNEYDDKVFVIHSGRRSETYHRDSQGTQCCIWNRANANATDKIQKSEHIQSQDTQKNKNRVGRHNKEN